MNKVYIVMASVGQDEERHPLVVAVCSSMEVAQKRVAELSSPAKIPENIEELYEEAKKKRFAALRDARIKFQEEAKRGLAEIAEFRADFEVKIKKAMEEGDDASLSDLLKRKIAYDSRKERFYQSTLSVPDMEYQFFGFISKDYWISMHYKSEYEKADLWISEHDVLE